jgi:formate dehydrogenase maturation protein FdhE
MAEISTVPEPFLIPKAERRRNRLALPDCPQCAGLPFCVLMRTEFVLYLRCASCHGVWSVWKPTSV